MNTFYLTDGVITIDVNKFFGGVCTAIYIIVGVALLIFLIKLIGTVSKVNKLIDDNRSNIDDTVKNLPAISSNVKDITDTVKDVGDSVKTVADSACATVASVSDTVGTVSGTINKAASKASLLSTVVSFLTMARPYILRIIRRTSRKARRAGRED